MDIESKPILVSSMVALNISSEIDMKNYACELKTVYMTWNLIQIQIKVANSDQSLCCKK